MVDISSGDKKINITVSSSGNKGNIATSPDMSMYYTEKSKEWAISDKIVDNTDYSAKYYAQKSKEQAQISTEKTIEVVNSGNEALNNIDNVKSNAIIDITNQETSSIDNIKIEGTKQVTLATNQANIATEKANIATTQAGIATAKTTEVVESGNTALSNIATAKSNALSEINATVDNAEQYAQSALNSANNAATSESNALSYKNAAQESSQTATEQANIATTKANEANISAENALTSENNAKTSELRCEEIFSRLGTAIKIKGRVDSFGDLPLSGNIDGDTYLVGEEGLDSYPEYYWYQDHWEFLGTSGTSLTWGGITGDITAQTDLMDKLNTKQNVLTAGTGIDITNNVISNTQTSAEWGNIQGTLSNQEDLQAALDNKQPIGDYASAADVEYLKNRTYTDGLQLDKSNRVKVLYDGETITTKPVADVALIPLVGKTGTDYYMTDWGAANPSGLDATRNIRLVWYPVAGRNAHFSFGGRYKTYLGFGITLNSRTTGQLKILKPSGITTTSYGTSEYWEIPEFTSNAVPLIIQADFDAVNKKWYLKCTVQVEGFPTYTKTVDLPKTCTSFETSYQYTDSYYQQYSEIEVYYISAEVLDKLFVPAATNTSAGVVKPDGETISVTDDGTLSANLADKADIDLSNLSETGAQIIKTVSQEELNNPFSLFDCKYSDHELNNISWLKSSGQWNDGNVYVDAYNELLTEYNNSESVEETEGSITFKRTPKGYKIALAEQDTAIEQKYSTNGIAWYYVLDTDNTQFKLPRTKFGFEGLRNKVGDDIAESLPNITGSFGYNFVDFSSTTGSPSGAFTTEGANGMQGNTTAGIAKSPRVALNASLSSSTYQDGAPVQERATQMYLYFYVGETVQNANLIDAGRIGEQLANKLDHSAVKAYITETYQNGTSWYRVYSDGWCEQGGKVTLPHGTHTYITLLKSYIYDYSKVNCLISCSQTGFGASSTLSANYYTANQIDLFNSNEAQASMACHWRVSGFIR